MHHILLIHSIVRGHLDCFHVLTTAKNAVVNVGVHESFGIKEFSLDIGPDVGLLGHMTSLFLFF